MRKHQLDLNESVKDSLNKFRATGLLAEPVEKSLRHESPCNEDILRTRPRKKRFRSGTTKVKQERAQGGCLGTESRRKT